MKKCQLCKIATIQGYCKVKLFAKRVLNLFIYLYIFYYCLFKYTTVDDEKQFFHFSVYVNTLGNDK